MSEPVIRQFYENLYRTFGPQSWWPGESPFEVIIGAILTQNTNWRNVERALANLKERDLLTPRAIHGLAPIELAVLIKPAGYYNIKARRVKNFIDFLFENYAGDLRRMAKVPTPELRREILAVNGIGPETADAILLYALDRPAFVIDAYTKRILYRHGLVGRDAGYTEMQEIFVRALPADRQLFNEYHALIVRTGKDFCRPQPRCAECPLNSVAYSLQDRCQKCYKTLKKKGRSTQAVCQNCHEEDVSFE